MHAIDRERRPARPRPAVTGSSATQSAPTPLTSAERTVPSDELERRRRGGPLALHEQLEPVAQGDPRQPKALRLGVERGAFGLPLGGELILEVVEEAIPAHQARLGQSSRVDHNLSTDAFSILSGNSLCVLLSARHPPRRKQALMATTPPATARAYRASDGALELSEFFAPQRTPSTALPDPEPFLRNLTRGVFEVLAGVRDVDQLGRWLTEDPYRRLVTRSNLAARARSARGIPAKRPIHAILSTRHSSPADGVIEAVVIVQGPARTRAVAMRLEGMDGRWRATSLAVL